MWKSEKITKYGSLFVFALGALLVLSGGSSTTAQAQSLKVGYVEFPPYSATDAGKPAGTLVEMLNKVVADAGLTVSYASAPARRLFQGLADGEYDLFMGIKTAKEMEGATFASDAVVAKIELRAYAWGSEPPAIKAKEDLVGKSVIVLTGYSYGGWRPFLEDAANKVQLQEARTSEQALAMLKGGKAPLLLQYAEPMAKALGSSVPAELKHATISSIDIHFVVSKKTANAVDVLSKLENSYKKLKASGGIN